MSTPLTRAEAAKIAEARDVFSAPSPTRVEATTGAPKPLPLALRIANAQAEIHTVEKKGKNEGQNYSYAREIDVLAQARSVLLKHGVVVVPSVPRVEFRAVPTRNGQSNLTDVFPVFTVKATDTEESFDCAWYGCGADTTDKGGNKAITASLKYFLIKLLLIPTGEADPDADSEEQVTTKPPKPKPEPGEPVLEDKAAERRKEVIRAAMDLSDKTKEHCDDILKKASAAKDRSGKDVSFDGKTIASVGNVAWLERTLNRLLDQLAKSEEDPPF